MEDINLFLSFFIMNVDKNNLKKKTRVTQMKQILKKAKLSNKIFNCIYIA